MTLRLVFAWLLAVLVLPASPPPAAAADSLRLAVWNIMTLATPGREVFAGNPARCLVGSPPPCPQDGERDDYRELRAIRDEMRADLWLLQEISSPAALDLVFPRLEGWSHCLSGQFRGRHGLPGSGPVCTVAGDPAAPLDPPGALGQFTAIAWRPTRVRLDPGAIVDQPGIAATHEDCSQGVCEQRPTRWGLEAMVPVGGARVRVLNLHLKTGCFDDPLNNREWSEDRRQQASKENCIVLARQVYGLKAWVRAVNAPDQPIIIAGDFNRRFDLGGPQRVDSARTDELLVALMGADTPTDPSDNLTLRRLPYKQISRCWEGLRNAETQRDDFNMVSIDYMLFDRVAWERLRPRDYRQIDVGRRADGSSRPASDQALLSDHCPIAVTLGR